MLFIRPCIVCNCPVSLMSCINRRCFSSSLLPLQPWMTVMGTICTKSTFTLCKTALSAFCFCRPWRTVASRTYWTFSQLCIGITKQLCKGFLGLPFCPCDREAFPSQLLQQLQLGLLGAWSLISHISEGPPASWLQMVVADKHMPSVSRSSAQITMTGLTCCVASNCLSQSKNNSQYLCHTHKVALTGSPRHDYTKLCYCCACKHMTHDMKACSSSRLSEGCRHSQFKRCLR